MTTKFKPEEWWPVLALHACEYTMSVYEAKGLLTLLSKHRCTASQWSDGRFEERGQPALGKRSNIRSATALTCALPPLPSGRLSRSTLLSRVSPTGQCDSLMQASLR